MQIHVKRLFFFVIVILIPFTTRSFGETTATTSDGREVILNDDGTWTPAKLDPISAKTSSEDFDFRATKWGFSQEEVKKSEKDEPILEKDGNQAYSDKISNQECLAVYVFSGNKLIRSSYRIVEKHTNKLDYLLDFERIKKLLTEKYGEPKQSKPIWKNSLYKNNPEDYGMAIAVGHLVFANEWETDRTRISHIILGDNYQINHVIEYYSKDLEHLEKESEKAATKNKL